MRLFSGGKALSARVAAYPGDPLRGQRLIVKPMLSQCVVRGPGLEQVA